jgi:hypothetical protein
MPIVGLMSFAQLSHNVLSNFAISSSQAHTLWGPAECEVLPKMGSVSVERTDPGGLRVTFSDRGNEIKERAASLSLEDIGRSHFEEAASTGAPELIEHLRRREWGPLWVRNNDVRGTEFRFNVPSAHVRWQAGESPSVGHIPDMSDLIEEIDRNLAEGFFVPAASMFSALFLVIQNVSPIIFAERIFEAREACRQQIIERISKLVTGMRHPKRLAERFLIKNMISFGRLNLMHQLLCGNKGVNLSQAIDNACGSSMDVMLSLAMLGSEVIAKDPDSMWGSERFLKRLVPPDTRQRIQLQYKLDQVNEASPGRVVYWTHPDENLKPPANMTLEEYMGRDVEPGGYLVIQTDHPTDFMGIPVPDRREHFLHLKFDSQKWERIISFPFKFVPENRRFVLPSIQVFHPHVHFEVYRRRPVSP